VVDDGYAGLCFNTTPYTYLGTRPIHVAPDATLDRALTMVTIRTLAMGPVLAMIGSALLGRTRVKRHPQADYHADVSKVTITGHGPFPYQVDGDHLGDVTRLDLRHVPDVLDLVLPR